jgi:choline dehydrogenase
VWGQKGNRGWSYADVLPYFRRCEGRIGAGDDAVRGRHGELKVSDIDWRHPLCEAFIDGVAGLGIPRNADHNDGEQAGVGYYQRTVLAARRRSSARSFLYPAMQAGQVDVRTHARAVAIVFDDRRAAGVRYLRGKGGDRSEEVRARREVIVASGTINSARLLQVSGVGPAALLGDLGVEVVADLPGVGENLQDHYAVRMVATVKGIATVNDRVRFPWLQWEGIKWLLGQPTFLGQAPSHAHVFWMSSESLDQPDLQFTFTPASYREGQPGLLDDVPGVTCGIWQHRPESVGYVRARSTDPFEQPIIQPNYLEAERDRQALLGGIRLGRRFLATPELSPWIQSEFKPGPERVSDDELLDWAYREGSTAYHLVGTCRMGPEDDPMAVVDPQLRVRGVQGLRVVDASVMPAVTSGNTNAPTMMIAEKASDLIRGRPAPSPA